MSKAQEVLTKMNVAAANLAAQLASEKLQEIGEQAAASFYGDYSPKQYGRSYGLYEASQPLVKIISGPGTAQGGITVSSASIGSHYHQGAETVFEWDFVGGEHGGYNTVSTVSKPSPMKLITNTFNKGESLIASECEAQAIEIVQAQYMGELTNAIIEDLKAQGVK